MNKIKYPIYIPSKARPEKCKSALCLDVESVKYFIVVEPQDYESYLKNYTKEQVLVMEKNDQGISYARSWIKKHSQKNGYKRHWQLDDNIKNFKRWNTKERKIVNPKKLFIATEKFADKYNNVGTIGFRSSVWGFEKDKPYKLNKMIYCCTLDNNEMDIYWRMPALGEDTDYSIQVCETYKFCTVLFHKYQIEKHAMGKQKGGNEKWYKNDGKIQRVKDLQKFWGEDMVKLTIRNGNPMMNVNHIWKRYTQLLEKKNQKIKIYNKSELNKYPIYVISKDRHDCCYTADFLIKDGVPFKLVIEPHQFDLYAKRYDKKYLITLPFRDLGLGSIPARNFVWDHAIKTGAERHWILDDNIRYIMRTWKGKRIRCSSLPAFKACEDFIDRYENIAIGGLNYSMFVVGKNKPFYHNCHVYSFMCIKNDIKYRWRGRYNEDTDLCLQVLSGGLCTVLINVFCCYKITTGTMKGGNATSLYKGDGRLTMANSLKRMWPGVVSVNRRYQRPQHIIAKTWAGFDTPLIKKKNLKIPEKNEYGLTLKAKNPIKSKRLQKIVDDFHSN